jgi:mono/diheme cytochrome c family protein
MSISISMSKRISYSSLSAGAALCLLSFGACRGNSSEEPPIHLQRNMFTQDKGKAQRENLFFADHRAMRPTEPGVVSTTAAIEPTPYLTGKDDSGQFVSKWPSGVTVDQALLVRGQQRFNIYCAPCHDRTGSGNGIVIEHVKRTGALWVPKSYYDDSVMNEPVGQLFDVITHGVRTMPAYAYQVPVSDRWAIVAYVRALQRSQNLSVAQLSPEQRTNLK